MSAAIGGFVFGLPVGYMLGVMTLGHMTGIIDNARRMGNERQ